MLLVASPNSTLAPPFSTAKDTIHLFFRLSWLNDLVNIGPMLYTLQSAALKPGFYTNEKRVGSISPSFLSSDTHRHKPLSLRSHTETHLRLSYSTT